jgi:hypothetical protein
MAQSISILPFEKKRGNYSSSMKRPPQLLEVTVSRVAFSIVAANGSPVNAFAMPEDSARSNFHRGEISVIWPVPGL